MDNNKNKTPQQLADEKKAEAASKEKTEAKKEGNQPAAQTPKKG